MPGLRSIFTRGQLRRKPRTFRGQQMTYTLHRLKDSGMLVISSDAVSIVIHKLTDLYEMGFTYVPGSRGKWVRKRSTIQIVSRDTLAIIFPML